MHKKIFIALIFALMLFSPRANAQNLCSTNGYTVLIINGMFTDKKEAVQNSNKLRNLLPEKYKGEPITFDYLYNPSHLGGVGDIVDAISQGVVDSMSDYDLREMLDDASDKVKTQKLLIIGYSQGNFYANNIFDRLSDLKGGVPSKSLGVYAIATPDDHVSNGGSYLTSDTDKIIAEVVRYFKRVMPPNTHIPLTLEDGNGHGFSNVYLKYKSEKIVLDIKESLDKLKINGTQNSKDVCISPQPDSSINKVIDSFLPAVDYIIGKQVNTISSVYNKIKSKIKGLTSLAKTGTSAAILSNDNFIDDSKETEIIPEEDNSKNDSLNLDNEEVKEVETKEDILQEKDNVASVLYEDDNNSQEEKDDDNHKNNHSSSNNDDEEEENNSGGGGSGSSSDQDQGAGNQNVGNQEDDEDSDSEGDEEIIVGDGDDVYVYDYEEAESLFSFNDSDFKLDLIGEKVVNLNVGDEYKEQGINALNKNNLGDIKYTTNGTVDTSKVGVYVLRYYGNGENYPHPPYIIRIVNVLNPKDKDKNDREAPSIKINGDALVRAVRHTGGYVEEGAVATDTKDGDLNIVITETYDDSIDKEQKIAYIASDKSGNLSMKVRKVLTSDYLYIPKYTFGTENGDGRNWQVWFFNGSAIFDFSNKYKNGYLIQEFKIEAQPYSNLSCLNCIKLGIFKTNPLLGFDGQDILYSNSLINNPQNQHDGQIYKVVMEWDATGYKVKVSHGDIIDSSTHIDFPDINENIWVGWCSSASNFKDFPKGVWYGIHQFSSTGLTGGFDMVLTPYPVYDPDAPSYDDGESDDDEEDTNDDESDEEENNPEIESILNLSLNNATGEISINPKAEDLSINLTSDRNVDWVSLKIENTEDPSIGKVFFSNSDTCIDGTKTCSRIWQGEISDKDKTLTNGIYRLKVHIKDETGTEYYDYLAPSFNVVGQGEPVLQ